MVEEEAEIVVVGAVRTRPSQRIWSLTSKSWHQKFKGWVPRLPDLGLTAFRTRYPCDIYPHKTSPIQNYAHPLFLSPTRSTNFKPPQPTTIVYIMAGAVVEATAEKRKAPSRSLRESTKRTRVERQVIGKGIQVKSNPTFADKT